MDESLPEGSVGASGMRVHTIDYLRFFDRARHVKGLSLLARGRACDGRLLDLLGRGEDRNVARLAVGSLPI